MTLTVKCELCGKDFESEGLERTEFCPHCGRETHVTGPSAPRPAQTSRMKACADCGAAMSRRAFWVAGFIIAAIGWLILKLIELVAGS